MSSLPPKVREWAERRLVELNFQGYSEFVVELNAQLEAEGAEERISRSAAHRFGQEVEENIALVKRSTEIMRTLSREAADDEGALNDGALRLVTSKLAQVAIELGTSTDEDATKLNALAKALSEVARASVGQKKWQVEARRRAEEAARSVGEIAKKAGLTDATIEIIKRKMIGIPG